MIVSSQESSQEGSQESSQEGSQEGSQESSQEGSQENLRENSQKLLALIASNAKITTQEMADKIGISRRAVAKTIAKLQSLGIIRRVGPNKGGHWEVILTNR